MKSINEISEDIRYKVIDMLPADWRLAEGPTLLTGKEDDNASFEIHLELMVRNCKRRHYFQIGVDDRDDPNEEPTIEVGEDPHRSELSWHNMISMAYYELALVQLHNKYITG